MRNRSSPNAALTNKNNTTYLPYTFRLFSLYVYVNSNLAELQSN